MASEKGFKKLISVFNLIETLKSNENKSDFNVDNWIKNCYEKLNDDFNTPMLIAELFDCVKFLNGVNIGSKNLNSSDKNKISTTFKFMLFDILGFSQQLDEKIDHNSQKELIELLIKIRSNARNEKNFKLSDEIRNELLNLGIKLNDDGSSSSFEIVK